MPRSRHLVLGRIVRVLGLRGEVKVLTEASEEALLRGLKGVYVGSGEEEPRYVELERLRLRPPFLFLKFKGVSSAEEAEQLVGKEVLIPREEAPRLPEGSYYCADILGLTVVSEEGKELGEVAEVWPTPANDVYVVRGQRGEWLLPAIRQVIAEVDLEGGRIVVKLMEGLINASTV
ncbi:MAG: ribosome maturation factor RimM [Candidatus Methylomirabilales bacterium]